MDRVGLELKDAPSEDNTDTNLKIQKPKRILHFSDGTMEEYSDSEDECDSAQIPEECISQKDLPWAPYMRLKANKVGSNVLAGIDYVGGGLASMLGITTSEAELAAAAAKRKSEEQENTNEENGSSWTTSTSRNDPVISAEVKNSPRASK